jgi:hypothetical protein
MAWEWISSVSTATVGVAAILGTNWVAGRGRRHERALAEERHKHERLTAHEAWIRDSRRDAYLGLLNLAEEVGQYVQRVHPMWSSGHDVPHPELPDLEAQRKMKAPVIAFGSDAVKQHMNVWEDIVRRAIFAAAAVTDDIDGARQQLHDLRSGERDARQALGQQVADELQGFVGSSTELDLGDR